MTPGTLWTWWFHAFEREVAPKLKRRRPVHYRVMWGDLEVSWQLFGELWRAGVLSMSVDQELLRLQGEERS